MKRVLLIAVCAATMQAADATLDSALSAEMDRIEASLEKTDEAKLDKDFAELVQPYRERLAKSRSATSPLLRLYRLRDAFVGAETLAFIRDHRSSGNDLEGFRAFWRECSPHFDRQKINAVRGPLLQAALRQGADNRAQKLFHASLPYAKVSSPVYGLYYLAEAEGNLRFRDFVASLSFGPAEKTAPKSEDLEAAYKALEAETLQFFAADPASGASIPVSARLKEARELIDQKANEAATLALLETRLTLSRRQASKNTEPPAVQKQTADTLLALWRDMAQEEEADVARYIRRDVIPLYTSLVRSGS